MLFAFSERLTEIHTGGRNNSVDYAQAESAERVRLKKKLSKTFSYCMYFNLLIIAFDS
jgi:hypothetical protein